MVANDQSGLILREFLGGLKGVVLTGEAANEIEVLQKLNDQQVDVVLLDLSLQGVDGIRLTQEIRESHPTVRVLISTALKGVTDIFAALDAGADGYVLKGNHKGLEVAISSLRLGAIWLDPGIATQLLEEIVSQTSFGKSAKRTLPTGILPMPLWPHEKDLLNKVAQSSCADGVCFIDPSFLKKLRGYAPE